MSFTCSILLLTHLGFASLKTSSQPTQTLSQKIQTSLADFYNQRASKAYFSGVALSVKLPKQPVENFYHGYTSHAKGSQKVGPDTLFSIGSITKSFTAVRLLQLEAQGKLKLSDKLIKYLPQYPKWGSLTLTQLLDMSSGLPNYSNSGTFNYLDSKDLKTKWRDQSLIDIVYPKGNLNPPLLDGYLYTNTGYLLAAMVIEKVTHKPFKATLESEILKPLQLSNTFYPLPYYSKDTLKRLASGYAYNQYDNPEIVGQDVKSNNLTWAGAAGAIVATPADIIHWVQKIFMDKDFLSEKQKTQMQQMVSTETGKPIKTTSAQNPRGFGLGIIQAYNPKLGRYWFYQGETLGFRAIYMYVPCNKVIIAVTLNSATNGENDKAGLLLQKVYGEILKTHPKLQCKS